MQVELAKSAGFCFGVQRAVDTVYKQIEENSAEKIYTYGPIIHNEEVIKDMEKKGVEVILSEEELKQIESGSSVPTAFQRESVIFWMKTEYVM